MSRRSRRGGPNRARPRTCWRCSRPALYRRAVCQLHADELERLGNSLKAPDQRTTA